MTRYFGQLTTAGSSGIVPALRSCKRLSSWGDGGPGSEMRGAESSRRQVTGPAVCAAHKTSRHRWSIKAQRDRPNERRARTLKGSRSVVSRTDRRTLHGCFTLDSPESLCGCWGESAAACATAGLGGDDIARGRVSLEPQTACQEAAKRHDGAGSVASAVQLQRQPQTAQQRGNGNDE